MNPTPPTGRKNQYFIPVSFPILPEFEECIPGHGNTSVLAALTAADGDLHTIVTNILHLNVQAFAQSETAGIYG
jgi:hypothetical protein